MRRDYAGVTEIAGIAISVGLCEYIYTAGEADTEASVYLDYSIVGIEPIHPFKIGQDVAAPADIAFPRTKFIFPGGWTVHFIILGYMIHAVMGTAAKFPDIIGDLDGKAVV